MKRLPIILAALVATAAFGAAVASAATIGDVQALGFTVSVSSVLPGPNGIICNVYYISGFGVGTYANECDPGFQSTIDSLANPVAQCNRAWQYNHPDQLSAFQSIAGKGWSVSGDQCADVYTVTNPNDNTTAYSGSGAGLPGFDQANGAPPAPPAGPSGPAAAPAPSSCLPLCPNPGDIRGGGGVLIPATPTTPAVVVMPATSTTAAQPLTATSVIAPITDPATAAAAAIILNPDRSAGYIARAGYGTDGALAP